MSQGMVWSKSPVKKLSPKNSHLENINRLKQGSPTMPVKQVSPKMHVKLEFPTMPMKQVSPKMPVKLVSPTMPVSSLIQQDKNVVVVKPRPKKSIDNIFNIFKLAPPTDNQASNGTPSPPLNKRKRKSPIPFRCAAYEDTPLNSSLESESAENSPTKRRRKSTDPSHITTNDSCEIPSQTEIQSNGITSHDSMTENGDLKDQQSPTVSPQMETKSSPPTKHKRKSSVPTRFPVKPTTQDQLTDPGQTSDTLSMPVDLRKHTASPEEPQHNPEKPGKDRSNGTETDHTVSSTPEIPKGVPGVTYIKRRPPAVNHMTLPCIIVPYVA